jgi:hypothetical protein
MATLGIPGSNHHVAVRVALGKAVASRVGKSSPAHIGNIAPSCPLFNGHTRTPAANIFFFENFSFGEVGSVVVD